MKVRVREYSLWPLVLLLIVFIAALGVYLFSARDAGESDVLEINFRTTDKVAYAQERDAAVYNTPTVENIEDADGTSDGRQDSMPQLAQLGSIFAPSGTTQSDVTIKVYDCAAACAKDMALEDYIYCVTASEMPARCELEALKAQAVAARTYAYMKIKDGGCGRGGADICTDSGHCQAYHSAAELNKNWGANANEYGEKVRRAVDETRGLIITYEGKPINALFHASSGGHTEDVENVYAQMLPYLRGVDSPGEESYSGYSSSITLSNAEFRACADKLGIKLDSGALDGQVSVASRTEAGQVAVLKIGDGAISGRQARKAFGLRSQNFTLKFGADGKVTFNVLGYGHGVGMSQDGADAMARAGSSFSDIITHYYTDVKIEPLAQKNVVNLWG